MNISSFQSEIFIKYDEFQFCRINSYYWQTLTADLFIFMFIMTIKMSPSNTEDKKFWEYHPIVVLDF